MQSSKKTELLVFFNDICHYFFKKENLKLFNVSQIEYYKTSLRNISKENLSSESELNRANFSNLFMMSIRKAFEENMRKCIANSKDLYDDTLSEILKFLLWTSENDYIDITRIFSFFFDFKIKKNFKAFLEDIYDCLSIKDISKLFEFLEKNPFKLVKSNDQNTLLRICNGILKKLSKSNEALLRGRVQIFLSKLLPLSHESGLNQKSSIDSSSITFDQLSQVNFSNDKSFINYNFYRKFWSLQKYLQNPLLLFFVEDTNPENDLYSFLENESDSITERDILLIDNSKDSKTNNNRFFKFFELVSQILEVLRLNPLNEDEKKLNNFSKFPKFLTQSGIFEKQIRDPYFRKIWLTQILLAIFVLKNPIKILPQKTYILTDDHKKILDKVEENVNSQFISLKVDEMQADIYENIKVILQKEKMWQEWKENNCSSYEKPPSKEIFEGLKAWEDYKKTNKNQNPSVSLLYDKRGVKSNKINNEFISKLTEKLAKIMNENAVIMKKQGQFDQSIELFKFLDTNKIEISEEPIEPSVAYYFDKIYYDMDIANEVSEEDKVKKEPNYIWKALRVLFKNDWTQFKKFGVKECSAETLIDEIATSLTGNQAVVQVENSTKETINNINENKNKMEEEGINLEKSKEGNKVILISDKEKEREKDKEREREKDKERDKEKEKEKDKEKEKEREMNKEREKEKNRQSSGKDSKVIQVGVKRSSESELDHKAFKQIKK